MAILVFNSGSSSLKLRLYTTANGQALSLQARGAIVGIGAQAAWHWQTRGETGQGRVDAPGHREAAAWVLKRLREESTPAVAAVGHRIVHGGDSFTDPVLLTADTIARIDTLTALAPLHNPPALEVIHACRGEFGDKVPMVAVFDTAFHATVPDAARCYALPETWVRTYGIRRYGFHGIAHRSMYERYLATGDHAAASARVITFQLGNGCSVCAVRNGRSVDTSMGYTPIEGLIMATRSGDVDPGALARLAAEGVGAAELDERLNRDSGLLALSGATGDMRELLALEAQGHAGARLAVAAFCYRARKYLGAYLAALGGADAILFGGGIGEHAPQIRERICADMEWCGVRLDAAANAAAVGTERRISPKNARPQIRVIAVDEEALIARDALALVASRSG